MIQQTITRSLHKALEAENLHDMPIHVTIPSSEKHGDYTSNVAMIASRKIGKNPLEIAEGLKGTLSEMAIEGVRKIEVVKPGFLNFWLDQEFIIASLNESLKDQGLSLTMQRDSLKKKGKVIVEYSSPNIAKPFTIGHLRSTIIGDAVANILEAVGYEVYRDNHVGDWGTQFGKQIYAIKTWGNEDEIDRAENPVKVLVALYVKFHEEAEKDPEVEEKAREWFKKLEDGDAEARRLWQKCIDWSWKEFQKIYDELGVPSHGSFENNGRGYGESFFENKMDVILSELQEKNLLTDSDGAQLVMYPKDGFPPLMIVKKDGATLYATRDLATDKFRKERYGDDIKIINEVGIEQELYFRQLYELEVMLGWFEYGQRVHLKHGHFRFKDQKMSTRKGNVIWLEDVIAEAKKRAYDLIRETGTEIVGREVKVKPQKIIGGQKEMEKVASQIAIGALKWNDLKRGTQMDVVFDWDDILNMQGNSGPYLQYTYVRTQSILRKSRSTTSDQPQTTNYVLNPYHDTLTAEERTLLRTLFKFDEVVAQAVEDLAPSHLATYLFDLAQKFNNFYQKHKILESEQRIFRTGLTAIVGKTIQRGLDLLGIPVPEKM